MFVHRLSPAALAAPLLVGVLLAGCATPTGGTPELSAVQAKIPAQWQAPLPHGGQSAALADWWRQSGDAALSQLIERTLADSPTLASAAARVQQARAQNTVAQAALLPTLGVAANSSRGTQAPTTPGPLIVATTNQLGAQANWEIDLFGRQRSVVQAAQARVQGAEAAAHLARVSLVAEVANQYFSLRQCQAQLATTERDAASRGETARLTRLTEKAGFTAPATAALADAAAAQSRDRAAQLRTACAAQTKGLVALTGVPEPELRQIVKPADAESALIATKMIAVFAPKVPADALRQRPDVWAAEREVLAARAEVASAQAERLPRLSLGGSIGLLNVRMGGGSADFATWSIGPLGVTLPIFDGGRIGAGISAAEARYADAVAQYQQKVRQAVAEVETAMQQQADIQQREADARRAVQGFAASLKGTEALYKQGMASLQQLEESRRNLLAAQMALNDWALARQQAGVALYRAMGGGWTPDASASTPTTQPAKSVVTSAS